MSDAATLARRLATFRASREAVVSAPAPAHRPARRGAELAERLAAAVGGEPVTSPAGHVVRVEARSVDLPLVRERLATLPGCPPPSVPLVCLDIETTGLATGAGTLAFLVGLGWWEGERFRGLQLLCPDHSEEPALLDALQAAIPPGAWLVTYNGRSFDWPILVTRFRLALRDAPPHEGHLDLLPHVRRLFRHRLGDARLLTVEREMLGVQRTDDVAGWEIPERFHAFVRGGSAEPLEAVVTHNAEDVRSLARLLRHLDSQYADVERRGLAPAGDLVALARGYTGERRHTEALSCLDDADAGFRPPAMGTPAWPFGVRAPVAATVSRALIRSERARALRRLGRYEEASAAWEAIARAGGTDAVRAWVEVAKLREHLLRDVAGALEAAAAASRILERLRWLDSRVPALEAALTARRRRLLARIARARPGLAHARPNATSAVH